MKFFQSVLLAVLSIVLVSCSSPVAGPETQAHAKPYPLKTCLVCGMELGSMGKPYAFVYQGQEIKICDQSEKALFDQAPDKYMKKLADAAAEIKK